MAFDTLEHIGAPKQSVDDTEPVVDGQTAARGQSAELLQSPAMASMAQADLTGADVMAQSTAGTGSALPYRAEMEAAFEQDFSNVSVHTGQAGLQAVQAKAITDGDRIATLDAQPDRKTIAHELTHVVQQRTHGGAGVAARGLSTPDMAGEQEAEQVAETVAAGGKAPAVKHALPASVNRSFISFAVKAGAKKAAKEMLKDFIEKKIKSRFKKFVNKEMVKKYGDEALDILSSLDDPWWATAIGFIPIVGDAFDLARVPMKIRNAIKAADKLEARVDKYEQWVKLYGVAKPETLINAMRAFAGKTMRFGDLPIKMDVKGMKHILSRHHPNFWDGSAKAAQSFFKKNLSPDDLTNIAQKVLSQNRAAVIASGGRRGQFSAVVDGVKYTVGLKGGRIGQLYPG